MRLGGCFSRHILAHDGTTAGAVLAADNFRDEILGLSKNTLTSRYRARLVTDLLLVRSVNGRPFHTSVHGRTSRRRQAAE
jgi:hypothetical protein